MNLVVSSALMDPLLCVVDDDAIVSDLHPLEGSEHESDCESDGQEDQEGDYNSFAVSFDPPFGNCCCLDY